MIIVQDLQISMTLILVPCCSSTFIQIKLVYWLFSSMPLYRLVRMSQYRLMLELELVLGSLVVSSLMMLKLRYGFICLQKIWTRTRSLFVIIFLACQDNAVVIHAIVGWKSSIGRWSRVQVSRQMSPFSFFFGSNFYQQHYLS